jgi:hypothetical protein
VFGVGALGLMIWDAHNLRIIESVGMGWDTGAPLWPYQASFILLLAINVPAFAIAVPFLNSLHFYTLTERYPVLFPIILAWWYWVETRIDFGILGRRRYRHPMWMVVILSCAGAALLLIAGRATFDDTMWFRQHGWNFWIILRSACIEFWAFILGSAALIAALQLIRRERSLRRTLLATREIVR